jgi:hypothetical protein
VPQDIPVEVSEVLAFTPSEYENAEPRPVFVLRAASPRDRRHHTRLYRENGLVMYGKDAVRAEMLNGLKAEWTAEQFAMHEPVLRQFWDAQDDYALQVRDDPDLVWSYDEEIERAVADLMERVEDAWPPLRRMAARNIECAELIVPVMLAAVVKNWSGFDHRRVLDRGYIEFECAIELAQKIEQRLGRTALSELFVACSKRMRIDEETAGNSASGSPSGTTPLPSTATKTSAEDGSSRDAPATDPADASPPTPEAA